MIYRYWELIIGPGVGRNRIGTAELGLKPHVLKEETFNGVNRPFVASLYKRREKKRKDNSKGYVLDAGLSGRKRMKQKNVGEYFKP
jgi:hypothetical protein